MNDNFYTIITDNLQSFTNYQERLAS